MWPALVSQQRLSTETVNSTVNRDCQQSQLTETVLNPYGRAGGRTKNIKQLPANLALKLRARENSTPKAQKW